MRKENDNLREKLTILSNQNQEISLKLNFFKQELSKFDDFSSHQTNLLENNKKEYDNLKNKVRK